MSRRDGYTAQNTPDALNASTSGLYGVNNYSSGGPTRLLPPLDWSEIRQSGGGLSHSALVSDFRSPKSDEKVFREARARSPFLSITINIYRAVTLNI